MSGLIGMHDGNKLAVCMPALDFVSTWFAYDLAGLYAHMASKGYEISRLVASGTYLFEQREALAAAVVKGGYFAALWLDTDMRFPKDAFVKLLARELAVVGAGYPSRHYPHRPVVARNLKTDERVWTTPQHEGCEEVAGIGFGCLLTTGEALARVDQPRFTAGWNPDEGRHVTEDMFFCHKLAQAGVPVHVDHDLTKEVAHLGHVEYTYKTSLQVRDAEEFADQPLIVAPGA